MINFWTKFINTANDGKREVQNTTMYVTQEQGVDIPKVVKLKGTFNCKKQMYKILNEMIEKQVQTRDITRVIRLSTKVNLDI